MHCFEDKSGQRWDIELTFGAVLRVKSLSDGRFDLLKPEQPIEHKELGDTVLQVAILLDWETFWEVLYFVVEPQCKERKINAEQFGELMAGDCLVKAREAFAAEWLDFFRSLRRPDQAKSLEKLVEWLAAGMEKVATAIANLDLTKTDKQVMNAMDSTLKRTFGKLAASSESTPASLVGADST